MIKDALLGFLDQWENLTSFLGIPVFVLILFILIMSLSIIVAY